MSKVIKVYKDKKRQYGQEYKVNFISNGKIVATAICFSEDIKDLGFRHAGFQNAEIVKTWLKPKKGLGRISAKRKPATKKQGTGSTKKTIRKHEGINQRTGKLKKGYKYGANGRIVKVQTPAQKVRQTGSTHRAEDFQRQAKRPGKRVSANGKTYYERRANRSDKGKLLAPIDGGTYGDLCYKKNPNGSTTIYTSHGGSRPCPYGGRVAVKTVSTLEPLPGTLRGVAKKKKPTAKQLAARANFAANVRAGKYRK